MKIDTYEDGRKIIDVRELKELEKSKEPISIKTSTKVREIVRYCDYFSDGKATTIYRGHQPYDDIELRTIKGWERVWRKPKSSDYVFSMRANYAHGGWGDYCFAEDTIELSEDEKELIRAEEREIRLHQKIIRESKQRKLKRAEGVWKTSWQWLSEDRRKVIENSIPEEKYNWLYDENSGEFEEAKKSFYYYSEYDTVPVSEEEYQELKEKYIKEFGGWEKIDLEYTDYDGKKWY